MHARTGFGAASWDDREQRDSHAAWNESIPVDYTPPSGTRQVAAAPPPPSAHLELPVWLVWSEGGEVIGPVSAQQLAHGIRNGRVPSDASVQRKGDVFWQGILDEADIITALKSM